MQRRIFIILSLVALILSACGNEQTEVDISSKNTEVYKTPEFQQQTSFNVSDGITIEKSDSSDFIEEHEVDYDILPIYYQQDYSSTPLKDSTVAEEGNLITCLSMVESFFNDKEITPDRFVDMYSNEINSMSPGELIKYIAEEECGALYEVKTFDFIDTLYYVKIYHAKLLVRIDHPSMYGNESTYLLITDLYDDQDIIVRDPNRENIENYSTLSKYGEPMYSATDLCVTIGQNSTAYIIY